MLTLLNKTSLISSMLKRLRSQLIEPDNSDMRFLQAYIDSSISLRDLLGHARQFSTEAHYHEWMHKTARLGDVDTPPRNGDDQFLVEVEALMRRKHLGDRT